MSLILEALSKAEQNNSGSSSGAVPQAYPLEKKSINKSLLLILVATACLTSATVTLLIIYALDSNGGASYTETHSAQEPASTLAKAAVGQPPAHQTAGRKTTAQSAVDEAAAPKDLAQRAPGFGHLISQRNHSHKTATATQEPSTIKTAMQTISSAGSDAQGGLKSTAAQDISEIKKPQLEDMEISVHMYSKTPAKRFVYINSTRYSENSLISDGIILDEITENGIILNVNGTRYRMAIKL